MSCGGRASVRESEASSRLALVAHQGGSLALAFGLAFALPFDLPLKSWGRTNMTTG